MPDKRKAKSDQHETHLSHIPDKISVKRVEPKKPLSATDSYILVAIQRLFLSKEKRDDFPTIKALSRYTGLPGLLISGRIQAINKNYNYEIVEQVEKGSFRLATFEIANDQDTANILVSLYETPQVLSAKQYHMDSEYFRRVTNWCVKDAGYLREDRNGVMSARRRVEKEWTYLQLLRSKHLFSDLRELIKTIDWDVSEAMKLLEVEAFSSISELMPPQKKTRKQSLIALPDFPPNPDQLTRGQFKKLLATIDSKEDVDKLLALQNYAQALVDIVQERIKEVLEIPPTEAYVSFRIRKTSNTREYLEAQYWDGTTTRTKYVRSEK